MNKRFDGVKVPRRKKINNSVGYKVIGKFGHT